MNRTQFGGDGPWVAVAQRQRTLFAKSSELGLPARGGFAALGRMDRMTHARSGRRSGFGHDTSPTAGAGAAVAATSVGVSVEQVVA